MIKRFSHKGLRDFFDTGRVAGINPPHAGKFKLILVMLKNAKKPEDMRKPNLKLHTLQGSLAGFFAVSVSGNLRVIFRFEGQDITDVDYLDYH